jgi:hypothetical protein
MGPVRPTVLGGSSNFLHSSLAKSGGFLFLTAGFALVSQSQTKTVPLWRNEIERSVA